jgi:hypothetical protein
MNAKLILFLSCFAVLTLAAPIVNADPRGGRRHFSSMSPRGGHAFTRGGATFGRSTSGTYRNWTGGNWRTGGSWSGGNWSGNWRHHHGFSGGQSIFIGGFGFPFFYGYPYYSYYPYGYYGYSSYPYGYGYDSSYGYGYDYYSSPAYGYGYYGNQGYGYGNQGYSYGNQGQGYDNQGQGYDNQGHGYGDRSSVAQLQRRLARAGYYHGAIDGVMGPETRSAIREFERSSGALGER